MEHYDVEIVDLELNHVSHACGVSSLHKWLNGSVVAYGTAHANFANEELFLSIVILQAFPRGRENYAFSRLIWSNCDFLLKVIKYQNLNPNETRPPLIETRPQSKFHCRQASPPPRPVAMKRVERAQMSRVIQQKGATPSQTRLPRVISQGLSILVLAAVSSFLLLAAASKASSQKLKGILGSAVDLFSGFFFALGVGMAGKRRAQLPHASWSASFSACCFLFICISFFFFFGSKQLVSCTPADSIPAWRACSCLCV